jgi:hypothetical protein
VPARRGGRSKHSTVQHNTKRNVNFPAGTVILQFKTADDAGAVSFVDVLNYGSYYYPYPSLSLHAEGPVPLQLPAEHHDQRGNEDARPGASSTIPGNYPECAGNPRFALSRRPLSRSIDHGGDLRRRLHPSSIRRIIKISNELARQGRLCCF